MPGENVVIAYRRAAGNYARLAALAAESARLAPPVIVAVPTAATRAAKDARLSPMGSDTPPITMGIVLARAGT